MHFLKHEEISDAFTVGSVPIPRKESARARREWIRVWILVCVVVPALAVVTLGQTTYEDEGYDEISQRGLEQIDRLNELLRQSGRVFLGAGIVLLAVVGLKILSPLQAYDSIKERFLKRAVRDVDELLRRIQKEAEATSADSKQETTDEGLLAGMMEVAEFSREVQVPSYVLTVSDLMLDNIRLTLKKLRRFKEGNAERYRAYMFTVIQGIKTITEQSAEAGVATGLAVDIREYFEDDRRYRAWRKVLARFARKGPYQESAGAFLIFMRNIKEGRPLVVSSQPQALPEPTVAAAAEEASQIPDVLSEETLPNIQQAAAREARNLIALVQMGRPLDKAHAWQFEFVRRQQQVHRREEAQRMLSVFLSCERKTLREITRIKMLPCRAWGHVLHMLGVEDLPELQRRAEDRLLTAQETLILEKAFLQTFAKRESLKHVYGHDEDAELMIDMHIPEIRRETLMLLRRLHETELKHLDGATETLNDEETPRHNGVRRLIEHYVHHGHNPPGIGMRGGGGPDAAP